MLYKPSGLLICCCGVKLPLFLFCLCGHRRALVLYMPIIAANTALLH
jgi:hypothetical protein